MFIAFLQQTEESVKEISFCSTEIASNYCHFKAFFKTNFSRSKFNITNQIGRSLDELVFSWKIQKYLLLVNILFLVASFFWGGGVGTCFHSFHFALDHSTSY